MPLDPISPTDKRIKEFCLRVADWKKMGVPIGLGDLKELATELGTPIPHFDEKLNLVWDVIKEADNGTRK